MKQRLEQWGPLLGVGVFCLAAWLLYHDLNAYQWRDIRQSLASLPATRVWQCLLLTALNYLVLIGYDGLAVWAIGHPLPLRQVAMGSFCGFVASYNIGITLGGIPVRYRLYSAFGLSAIEILRLMIMLGMTFWIGEFALAGVVFLADPFPVPSTLHLPVETVQPLGWFLVTVAAIYVGFTAVWRKPMRLGTQDVHLPGMGLTLAQMAVAVGDLGVAAASLYVLMPNELGMGYPQFLGVYLLAVVAVALTQVPGGIGVFELVFLTLATTTVKQDVVAALLTFRLIYYLLPLLLAALLLGANEYRSYRRYVGHLVQQTGRLATSIAPTILSCTALIAGAVLLLSGATPTLESRLRWLKLLVPLPLLEASHFLGSLTGAALLLVARGLQRRLDSAWWMAVSLLAAGIVLSLLKGFDYEEAILLALVLTTLIGCRHRFYRKGSLWHERFTPGWIGAILLIVACWIWLGVFTHKHVDYQAKLWWQFTFAGNAPRFLRASAGVTVVLLVVALRKLVMASRRQPLLLAPPVNMQAVACLVAQSTHTSANLALLGDKRFLFNADGTALIMYAVQGRSWVSMGDPVGPSAAWPDLIWAFRERCDQYDGWPVFYQIDPEHLPVYLDQGFTLLKLGEEARVYVREFSLQGSRHRNLRSTRNRLEREGYHFRIVPRDEAPPILSQLRGISDAWLQAKHVREKGFSLGFFDETYVQQYDCAVVTHADGIVAFANLWLGAGREEFSMDLMRYEPDTPNGLMDYLITELILWGKQQGYAWFNLGMAPLSGISDRPLAPLWNRAVGLVYRHGDHFYSFDGLRQYKEKFDPVWTPKYLAAPGGLTLPRILADVTRLIGKAA